MTNEEMRKVSGKVNSSNRVTCFLYLLMRDKLPCGTVEAIMEQVEMNPYMETNFTNGWLAEYAISLTSRLII